MTSTTRTIHYRPFVLTKQAEWHALRALNSGTYPHITPVYVVAPREWDYDNNRPKKTIDEHVTKVARQLHGTLQVRRAYLDVTHIEVDGPLASGASPMEFFLGEARKAGIEAIPMVSASSSASTIAAASAAASTLGVAIRLASDEWPSSAPAPLANLLSQLRVAPASVDLFLDARDNLGALTVRAVTDELTHLAGAGFRSITFAGAAWPKTAPAGPGNHEVPRQDFATFRSVTAESVARGLPIPDYSDWTISHPDPQLDVDPKILNISASFRYPAEQIWVMGKGQLYKGNGGKSIGGAAVAPMLNALAAHPEYGVTVPGATETWIDGARAGGSCGNPTTWRQWAVLRHLELTVHQLANLP